MLAAHGKLGLSFKSTGVDISVRYSIDFRGCLKKSLGDNRWMHALAFFPRHLINYLRARRQKLYRRPPLCLGLLKGPQAVGGTVR
jgi:hypothetical protein